MSTDTPTLPTRLHAYERSEICAELERTHGDVRAAARALGVPERSLWAKIKRLGIDPGEYRSHDHE